MAYEDKGANRQLRQLCSTKLEQFKTMEEYVTAVLGLSQRLTAVQKPLDDEFLGALLLQGLPDDYEPMIMALENSVAELTSDFVKCKLLQEDKRGSSGETAHYTATRVDTGIINRRKNRTVGTVVNLATGNKIVRTQTKKQPLKQMPSHLKRWKKRRRAELCSQHLELMFTQQTAGT